MDFSSNNYYYSDWRSSFEDHPQSSILKHQIERSVHDLFLEALRSQSHEFICLFSTESQIDDFCNRMCRYWESGENYEICSEIVQLRESLKAKMSSISPEERGQEMVIREWLKSSF
jgi:hypothetical protein